MSKGVIASHILLLSIHIRGVILLKGIALGYSHEEGVNSLFRSRKAEVQCLFPKLEAANQH